MRRLSPLAVVLLLAAAGCGDGGSESGTGTAPAATTAATTGGDAGSVVDGKAVFADAACGSCHTLAAAGAGGVSGPNLDELRPDVGEVADQVRDGGGGMPGYQGNLSDAQIEAVARFVADNAGG